MTLNTQKYLVRSSKEKDLIVLPHIEREAAQRFVNWGFDAISLNECLPQQAFQKGHQEKLLWVTVTSRDEAVGFALFENVSGFAYLKEIDVLPAHAGNRLGQAMIEQAEENLRTVFKSIYLTTFKDIPWNAPYYHRLGFKEVALADAPAPIQKVRRTEQEDDLDRLPRIIMVKPLPPHRT